MYSSEYYIVEAKKRDNEIPGKTEFFDRYKASSSDEAIEKLCKQYNLKRNEYIFAIAEPQSKTFNNNNNIFTTIKKKMNDLFN